MENQVVTMDVVRVKVKKYDGLHRPDSKKFSIDPNLTTFQTLRDLLRTAFTIKGDFVISYLVPARRSLDDRYLPMLSDWDVRAALLGASDPLLILKVDLKPFDEGLDEWDIIEEEDVARADREQTVLNLGRVPILAQAGAGKLLGGLRSALLFGGGSRTDDSKSGQQRAPLSDTDFRKFLDAEGRLIRPELFRLAVYQGGVEPSLRPVAWRHLLNIYPKQGEHGLTGEQRIAYSRRLNEVYYNLKTAWQRKFKAGYLTEEMRTVANMVRKDVLRTDRTHAFYASNSHHAGGGNHGVTHLVLGHDLADEQDSNVNVLSLFNILTTYALTHPDVSYCQGMSDLASPLLVVLKDEGDAYVCFCALMRRLRRNFSFDGRAMTKKFKDLEELLQYFDPVFFEYLRECHADDLLFCYRWLLLELKREFKFDDALLMLEVMWSTIPPDPPEEGTELSLFDLDVAQDPRPLTLTLAGWPGQQAASLATKLKAATVSFALAAAAANSESEYAASLPTDEQSDQSTFGGDDPQSDTLNNTVHSVTSVGTACNRMGISYVQQQHKREESAASSNQDLSFAMLKQELVENWRRASVASFHSCPTDLQDLSNEDDEDDDLGFEGETPNDPPPEKDWLMHSSYPPKHLRLWLLSTDVRKRARRATFTVGEQQQEEAALKEHKKEEHKMPDPAPIKMCSAPFEAIQIITTDLPRQVPASAETQVADALPATPSNKPTNRKSSKEKASPVPVANDAIDVLTCSDVISANADLKLSDIYDMVLNQSLSVHSSSETNSAPRSRHWSGAGGGGTPGNEAGQAASQMTSSGVTVYNTSEKSRHASSNATSVNRSGPPGDSGMSTSGIDIGSDRTTGYTQSNVSLGELQDPLEFVNVEKDPQYLLPPPQFFGDGNPFMLFICLSLLLLSRDHIIKQNMDYNEIAMYFDKMARCKNDVRKALQRARVFYADYLKSGWSES